jgi:HEAT repeat protein
LFKKLQNASDAGIKWAIGNALSVVADDKVFNEIVELVQDPHNGRSRQMMVIALGNMKDLHAEEVLIGLLGDEEVVGHAIIALGKLKSQKAYPDLERFLSHPKAWIRKAAKQALARIDKTKIVK